MADNIFDSLQLINPLQEQQLRQQRMLEMLQQQPNSAGRFGTALGGALRNVVTRYRTGEKGEGFFHRLKTGFPSQEAQQAADNEQILTEAARSADQAVKDGVDPLAARAGSLLRAAGQFAARGRGNIASQLQAQAMQLRAQIEVRAAELDKLRADTREANARADSLGAPEAPKDELTRMQDQRAVLSTQLSKAAPDSPSASALARLIDETDQRIQKIITITGRTETDAEALGLTKPTINKLQDSLITTQPLIDTLAQMSAGFDPQFYTLAGRLKSGRIWLKDIIGSDLSPDEKTYLVARTENIQQVNTLLTDYIRSKTGAQMSGLEIGRLQSNVPAPGDSPTELKTKMDFLSWAMPALVARAQAALAANDLTIIHTPLEDWKPEPSPEEQEAEASRARARALLYLDN